MGMSIGLLNGILMETNEMNPLSAADVDFDSDNDSCDCNGDGEIDENESFDNLRNTSHAFTEITERFTVRLKWDCLVMVKT